MNYKTIGKIISQLLSIEAFLMLPALFISLFDKTNKTSNAFIATILFTLFVSLALYLLCRKANSKFRAKEGLFCVGIAWIVMSFFGSLPFYISGEIKTFVDAFFETVSGFTTTGSSVVTDVRALSRAALYWRSFTHWIGGMGVLVFLMAVAPSAKKEGGHTLFLLRAESTGPEVGKIVPHMKQTAKILYFIYIGLTITNIVFLLFGGMNFFEALCTAFGTAGTGGFGVKADSLASFSPYIQIVTTIFMFLFGINFNMFYLILLKRIGAVLKNEELRFYVITIIVSILLISLNVKGMYNGFGETLRHSAFSVVSIITTTGYATTNFNLWPYFSQSILLFLMIIGACAGSTGGGMKCARAILLFKSLRKSIRASLYPNKIESVLINKRPVHSDLITSTSMYLIAYFGIMVISFLVISIDGLPLATNFSAVISTINNVGPGFELIGPMENFALFSPLSKIMLIFNMLAGRLEIFPIIALFSRHTWK